MASKSKSVFAIEKTTLKDGEIVKSYIETICYSSLEKAVKELINRADYKNARVYDNWSESMWICWDEEDIKHMASIRKFILS